MIKMNVAMEIRSWSSNERTQSGEQQVQDLEF